MPLVYTLNWNGNFNEVFKTRWSASVMSEAKGKNLYYYAVGNELNLDKFNMFVDFMYSQEASTVTVPSPGLWAMPADTMLSTPATCR